jgi:hypothetical protein
MRWLRLYDDTINDPKILKLPEAMRWHWIAMLCVASKNEGALPNLDDIAIQLRVTPAKATLRSFPRSSRPRFSTRLKRVSLRTIGTAGSISRTFQPRE